MSPSRLLHLLAVTALAGLAAGQASNSDAQKEFGKATITYFGTSGCQAEAPTDDRSDQEGPFRTQVIATPGVCNLATGTPVQSGSWVVNCAPTPNDNNNGIIFFCQDTACASCSSQFAFNNSGTSDSKLQCIDLPNAGSNTSTGSRSFQAQCDTGSRQRDAEEQEQQNGAAASVATSLAAAAGTLAAALLMMA